MNPLLVICRTERGLWILSKLPSGRKVIVASDDPRVLHLASIQPNVNEVRYIERMESFYSVSGDVRASVRAIDDHLAALAPHCPGIPIEALRWGCTVEGGLTSQRIQDAFLLIDAYLALLDATRASDVWAVREPQARWDDLILGLAIRHRGLRLHRIGPRVRTWLLSVGDWLRPWTIIAYRILHLFRQSGGLLALVPKALNGLTNTVVFVLCSPARNHQDNVLPVMSALRRHGAGVLVLSWSASGRMESGDSSTRYRQADVRTARLEKWSRASDILDSLWQSWRAARLCSRANTRPALAYRGIDLQTVVERALRHFFYAELPIRTLFHRALSRALAGSPPLAVKPWGAPEGFEYRAISQLWQGEHRPLVFQYWLGVGMAWPYADAHQRLDLFLAKDRHEANQVAEDYQLRAEQIALVGQIRMASCRSFAEATPVEVSRDALNLRSTCPAVYIGFDPNCALRGYQSAREQAEVTRALLETARLAPGLQIIIKAHPAYPIAHLMPLISSYRLANVTVLPCEANVHHFLNSVDVVISKYSTLLLEAALMRRVSLAVILDGDQRFRVFGTLAPAIGSTNELTKLLLKLAGDRSWRETWMQERLKHQEKILAGTYLTTDGSPSELAALAILKHARQRQPVIDGARKFLPE